MCNLFFSIIFFEIFLLYEILSEILTYMYIGHYVKYLLLFSNFNNADKRSENPQIPDFMKIRSVGTELFYANRQTDRHTDREIDRQAERQTERQTDRQT